MSRAYYKGTRAAAGEFRGTHHGQQRSFAAQSQCGSDRRTAAHLAGITVGRQPAGTTGANYPKNLRDQGLVETAEERRQACFHAMVSDRYTEWREANQLAK
jgi:hypothetical protein